MPWGVRSNLNMEHIMELADEGKRDDGRTFDQFRNLDIRTNIIGTSEGSAEVILGKTRVIAGVKLGKGDPYHDNPDEGVLITTVQLRNPYSSFSYGGTMKEDAIELARVVDRGIRGCGAVNLEKLCIERGESVWVMFLDIQVLNDDGNLFDAAGIAATAALATTKIPNEDIEVGLDKIINKTPIPVTIAKINNALMIDPNSEEETIAGARITITTFDGNGISAIQKGLSGSFDESELKECINMAIEASKPIRERIKTII